jgi:hypothetical protein
MKTDFQFLCKQLADDLSIWVECQIPPTELPTEQLYSFRLLNRVYKALAEAKANEVKKNDRL